MSYITVKNIVKEFSGVQVLKGVDLGVESGELVTLLGPSGCGKSTLLRVIAGLEEQTTGELIINGQDVTNVPVNKRNLGMVFQQYSLFPNMSVYDNVAFGLKIKKIDKNKIKKDVSDMLSLVGLDDKADAYPGELSGGQQQRVALARALIVKPSVLLLDEPLSALDAKIKLSLRKLIKNIQRELKITTIFVTHDQEEALSISDRIFVMENGIIVQSGTPFEIYTKPKSRFVAGFLGTFNFIDASLLKDEQKTGEILIRPEHIEIVRDGMPSSGQDVYPGKVKDFSFFGNITRLVVNIGDASIFVDILNNDDSLFTIGQDITIKIPREKLIKVSSEE